MTLIPTTVFTVNNANLMRIYDENYLTCSTHMSHLFIYHQSGMNTGISVNFITLPGLESHTTDENECKTILVKELRRYNSQHNKYDDDIDDDDIPTSKQSIKKYIEKYCIGEDNICTYLGRITPLIRYPYNILNHIQKRIPLLYVKTDNVTERNFRLYVNTSCNVKYHIISLYTLLTEWINFAYKEKIIWWISYRSLLGSLRLDDIIPYDAHLDIGVLNAGEHVLQKFETPRNRINSSKLNIIFRDSAECSVSQTSTTDQSTLTFDDTSFSNSGILSFCEPHARVFRTKNAYINIYPVELVITGEDGSLKPISADFVDDYLNSFSVNPTKQTYDFTILFPLKACNLIGLSVPCPNKAEYFIETVYGKNYLKPKYLCNLFNGKWELNKKYY
ncbi:unnamed protein product [Trichobilharzia szidati]|nr:unnamed protein product [Trichobilharzia szidati]